MREGSHDNGFKGHNALGHISAVSKSRVNQRGFQGLSSLFLHMQMTLYTYAPHDHCTEMDV
jgi:hypothetical protein